MTVGPAGAIPAMYAASRHATDLSSTSTCSPFIISVVVIIFTIITGISLYIIWKL